MTTQSYYRNPPTALFIISPSDFSTSTYNISVKYVPNSYEIEVEITGKFQGDDLICMPCVTKTKLAVKTIDNVVDYFMAIIETKYRYDKDNIYLHLMKSGERDGLGSLLTFIPKSLDNVENQARKILKFCTDMDVVERTRIIGNK